uniref:hypothetical protein n=1 Tax=Campylaephora boydenii TaxID=202204 RepID=UPI0025520368|nr:hypothetical protein QQR83_pgp086 [Campylaephora boydenii]WGT74092.1 hypothetical protein [Campylaephora boydenii]
MMSIVNFSPYRQYLYSPISYIHKISLIYKICFIVFYLLSFPLIPHIVYLSIFIYLLMYYLLIKHLQLKYKYKNQFLKKIFTYTILLIIFIISSNKTIDYNYRVVQISYPYIIQKKLNTLFFIICLKSYKISTILLKTILFIYNTTCVLKILFYTTKLENILILCLYCINFVIKSHNLFYITFIFSCSLSAQFLYFIINRLKNNNIGIKIRKTNQLNLQYLILYYYFIFFINQILDSIENITYALYNKEITNRAFYLISI